MHKYLSLSKTLIKGSAGMLSDGKNKNGMSVFLYGIMLISLITVMSVVYSMVYAIFDKFGQIDQVALPMGMMIFMATMIIFFFSMFLIPSIFYFSNDNTTLLTLPLNPVQIIGAKFTVCVLYEYIFAAGILLPTYIAYIEYANPNILFYITALVVLLLVPIFPLVCSTIFTILIMRFVPFFKNRDHFNLIAGIITIGATFTFSFMSNSFSSVNNQEQILELFLQGNNSLLALLSNLFPANVFFSKALCDNDMLSLVIAIAITLCSLLVLLTLGKHLYFKGAIGFGETSSSSKKLNEKDMHIANKRHGKIRTYALKELKILLRTPVFFMNCIAMCIMLPIFVCVLPLLDSNINIQIENVIANIDHIPNFEAYIILLGMCFGFAAGGLNLISATAISREGSHFEYMKYIPMPYRDQIYAKCICGICLGSLSIFTTLVPLAFMLSINPLYFLLLFICSCLTTIIINLIGILFDMLHPKLIWEQEAAAVKQNMAGAITMLLGFAICALIVFLSIRFAMDNILVFALAVLLATLILTILMWFGVGKAAEKLMQNL